MPFEIFNSNRIDLMFCIVLHLQLSLRENPLVVRFVRDLTYNPPTLLELAGRVIKLKNIPFNSWELPNHLATYLVCAHQCVNPKCQGKLNSDDFPSFIGVKSIYLV